MGRGERKWRKSLGLSYRRKGREGEEGRRLRERGEEGEEGKDGDKSHMISPMPPQKAYSGMTFLSLRSEKVHCTPRKRGGKE